MLDPFVMQIWTYKRTVHLYETDLMGVVHHSNYLRYLEEARTSFAQSLGFFKGDIKDSDQLAVYDLRVRYLKPLRFGKTFDILTRARVDGVKVYFQYKILYSDQIYLLGETVHVLVDTSIRVKRLSEEYRQKIGVEPWTETWL